MEAFRTRIYDLLLSSLGSWLLNFKSSNLSLLRTSLSSGEVSLDNLQIDVDRVNELCRSKIGLDNGIVVNVRAGWSVATAAYHLPL